MKIRDYQKTAIKSVFHEFKKTSRATLSMACGTGKTITSLWIAEKLKAQRIIIFLPSLTLIKQTINVWVKNFNHHDYYTICSLTKIYDDISIDNSINGLLKTTAEIKKTLNNTNKPFVVFCTYQSSILIPSTVKFDFAIYDEAHKTAHEQEKSFRYPLFDKNIPITKRLFITATPRIYTYKSNKSNKNTKISYSMDNTNIYGNIVFNYNFTDAIKENIICDYKLLITIIKKDDLFISPTSDFSIEAHKIALQKTYEKIPISKSITFHKTINSAKLFTDNFKQKDIYSLHINGKFNEHERNKTLKTFETNKSTISNARFLSEGIDIPNLDLVAFMSPKKSKIDIIQAVGRVLRKAPGKKYGYILIPVYINQKNLTNYSEILQNNNYRYLWNIINSLRYYDSSLQKEINESTPQKRRLNTKKIHICTTNQNPLSKEDIEQIDIHIIDTFKDVWYEKFNEYKEFINKYKKDPSNYSKNYNECMLSHWVYNQRNQRYSFLSNKKIKKLKEIGFKFNAIEDNWYKQFKKFKESINKKGIEITRNNSPECCWFYYQRKKINSNALPENLKTELTNFLKTKTNLYKNMLQISPPSSWHDYMPILENYYKKHGHCNIPKSVNRNLYSCLNYKRKTIKNISDTEKKYLDSMNFKWNLKS